MDEIEELRSRVRRGPWTSHDLNDVFAQKNAVETVPGGVATDLGEPPEYTRYINTGIRNGDFATPPPDVSTDISDISNKLPDWSLVVVQGSSITAKAVADSSSPSGYVIRFTCAAGNANDEIYLEQTVDILSDRQSTTAYMVQPYWLAGVGTGTSFTRDISVQYLNSAYATTGAADSSSAIVSTALPAEATGRPDTDGVVPSDAKFLRIRIGISRAFTDSTTVYIDLVQVATIHGVGYALFPDSFDPTQEPASIYKINGVMYVASELAPAGSPMILMDANTDTVVPYGSLTGVRVRRTDTQSIADTVDESVRFTAADDIDPLGWHAPGGVSQYVTVSVTGVYAIGGGATFANDVNGVRAIWIELNNDDGAGARIPGTYVKCKASDGAGATALSTSTIFSLTANDTIALTTFQDCGAALDITDATMWCHLLMAS